MFVIITLHGNSTPILQYKGFLTKIDYSTYVGNISRKILDNLEKDLIKHPFENEENVVIVEINSSNLNNFIIKKYGNTKVSHIEIDGIIFQTKNPKKE